jgi:hypothetical protein
MGTSDHLKYSKVAGETAMTSQAMSFCFLGIIWVRATIDIVDLFMSFGRVTLGFFRLFLSIGPFGRLEHLVYEILELVIVPGLMLSLGVENADAIHEAFKFTRPGPVLLVASQLFHRVNGMIHFPLLVVSLGWARLIRVAWLLLLLLFGVECHLLDCNTHFLQE